MDTSAGATTLRFCVWSIHVVAYSYLVILCLFVDLGYIQRLWLGGFEGRSGRWGSSGGAHLPFPPSRRSEERCKRSNCEELICFEFCCNSAYVIAEFLNMSSK